MWNTRVGRRPDGSCHVAELHLLVIDVKQTRAGVIHLISFRPHRNQEVALVVDLGVERLDDQVPGLGRQVATPLAAFHQARPLFLVSLSGIVARHEQQHRDLQLAHKVDVDCTSLSGLSRCAGSTIEMGMLQLGVELRNHSQLRNAPAFSLAPFRRRTTAYARLPVPPTPSLLWAISIFCSKVPFSVHNITELRFFSWLRFARLREGHRGRSRRLISFLRFISLHLTSHPAVKPWLLFTVLPGADRGTEDRCRSDHCQPVPAAGAQIGVIAHTLESTPIISNIFRARRNVGGSANAKPVLSHWKPGSKIIREMPGTRGAVTVSVPPFAHIQARQSVSPVG